MIRSISILLLLLLPVLSSASAAINESTWHQTLESGSVQIKLWFFWSQRCRHCQEARPVIEQMANEHDWLQLESKELINSSQNRKLFFSMGKRFGREARSVPTFFFCNTMVVGFEDKATTGEFILERLKQCKSSLEAGKGIPASISAERIALSQATGINTDGMSVPLITVIIAGLDAFNPCAFFVLLFLLSLMIHVNSRRRMLLIGSVFVLFSGLIYFLFMAAWLNVFLLMGTLRWVTIIAGIVATTMGVLNIKDYFITAGPSLSISEKARPGLFDRMRKLLNAENLPAMLAGTVLLAIAANSYELLCTSGLPMVYTRLLTLEDLPVSSYYLYLLLYNIIYVLPLLIIVIVFVTTLGSRKLQAHEGRALKLLSGIMMFALGLLLIFVPEVIGNLKVTIGIILSAIVVAFLAYRFGKRNHVPADKAK
jgi:hypothetical protein